MVASLNRCQLLWLVWILPIFSCLCYLLCDCGRINEYSLIIFGHHQWTIRYIYFLIVYIWRRPFLSFRIYTRKQKGEPKNKIVTVKKLPNYFGVKRPKFSATEIWGSQTRNICIVSQYETFGVVQKTNKRCDFGQNRTFNLWLASSAR
jgi:hypothetical protein